MEGLAQRALSRFLERLLPVDVAEALVGDLREERTLRAARVGPRQAALWYWGQVVRSLVPVLHGAFRSANWVPAWVVGFVGFSFAVSVEVAARDAVAKVATHGAVDAIPVLILYLGALALAGSVAERVRAGAALALTMVIALTAVVGLITAAHGMPLWYRLVLPIAGPAAALAGAALFRRRSRGAPASRRRKTVA
jgi:hypothetical protein